MKEVLYTETETDVKMPEPLVPEPTSEFYHELEAAIPHLPAPRAIPTPIPIPVFFGARFLIWKQDPSVREPGIRTSYIPSLVLNGPRDARIATELPRTTPRVSTPLSFQSPTTIFVSPGTP